jgi:plasmid stabilization system protein ParE
MMLRATTLVRAVQPCLLAFIQTIQEAVARIEDHPLAYQQIIKDARRANLRRFPYGVWFRTHPEETIVFAVLAHKRDPRVAQKRSRGPMD